MGYAKENLGGDGGCGERECAEGALALYCEGRSVAGPAGCLFCASLEASRGCSRPNSFVRLVLAAEPSLTLTRSSCVDPE